MSFAMAGPRGAASSAARTVVDPIAQLAERLSASHGLWRNGMYPSLGLTANASSEQVLARVFELAAFDKGRVSTHRIVESRQIRISGEPQDLYTALLVDTNLGRKIVLVKFDAAAGWWSRVYESATGPSGS